MEVTTGERVVNQIVEDMSSVVELIDLLREQGYDQIFELVGNKLMSLQTCRFFYPADFNVDRLMRIEQFGQCYALSHRSEEFKGIFMAYLIPDII